MSIEAIASNQDLNRDCEEALFHLENGDFPFLEKNKAWVQAVLEQPGPITDANLRKERGSTSQPSRFGALETSSWNLIPSQWMNKAWEGLSIRVVDALRLPSHEAQQEIFEIKKDATKELESQLDSYLDLVHTEGASLELDIQEENVMLGNSGADLIVAAQALTGKSGKLAATTLENGSGVNRGLKPDLFELRVRDQNTDEPYAESKIVDAWKDAIDKGAEFLSLTAVTKTGLDYTQEGGVLEQVLEYVMLKNEEREKAGQDQIVVIVDCVQMTGRTPMKKLLEWLGHPAVAGIVHTGSKACGGSPHTGFLILSEHGKNIVKKTLSNEDGTSFEGWASKHKIVSAPLLEDSAIYLDKDPLTVLRAADNCRAVVETVSLPEDEQLYSEKGKEVEALLSQLFECLGFREIKVPNKVDSLVALHAPADLSPVNVKDILLDEMRKRGVELGGYLQEGLRGILRITPNIQWFKDGLSVQEIQYGLFGNINPGELFKYRQGLPALEQIDPFEGEEQQNQRFQAEKEFLEKIAETQQGILSVVAEALLATRGW